MSRAAFGIAGVLVVAALVGLSFAPAASATRYDFDITKTVKGYTIHLVGWIDVDQQAKTITGHIHLAITDSTGKVVFEKDIDFSASWASAPAPIRFVAPGARLFVTISFSGWSMDVTAVPLLNPSPLQLRRGHLNPSL